MLNKQWRVDMEKYKNIVLKFLNDTKLKYEVYETKDRCRFKLLFEGLRGAYRRLQVIILLDEYTIQTVVYLPSTIDTNASSCIIELITRLNYNLKLGKFEFNIDSGEIKFQLGQSIAVLESTNVGSVLEIMLYQSLFMADGASVGIEDAIKGELTSNQIFDRIINSRYRVR